MYDRDRASAHRPSPKRLIPPPPPALPRSGARRSSGGEWRRRRLDLLLLLLLLANAARDCEEPSRREDGARGGRAGLLLTRARCEMIGLARQRRRGPAQRGAAGAPSDGGDGRRMEAAWLASIIPRAPGQIKIHYSCSPASRRSSPPRGSRLLPRALRSPGSLLPL